MILYRPMSSRQMIGFPLTDAFIDANSLETMEGMDEIDDFHSLILTTWTWWTQIQVLDGVQAANFETASCGGKNHCIH